MRSSAGVGTTPPNVPGAPKPLSSVMMSSTLGAPFGGTTRGAHQAFDSEAFSLITPPNFGSGDGSCLPSRVVVAPGEPGTPVTCCAETDPRHEATATIAANRFKTSRAFIASPEMSVLKEECLCARGPRRLDDLLRLEFARLGSSKRTLQLR